MKQYFDKFMELPILHKIGAFALSFVFFSYVFYQFLYKSSHDEFVKLSETVDQLNAGIVKEQRIARNLGRFRNEVKDLDIKLKFALQELPDKREIPDLLNSISNLARDAGLEVLLFKPNSELIKDFYAEVPVNVSVEGTYHQVATFFDEVGQLSRIVNISGITLNDAVESENGIHIKADCLATTFRYLDENERGAATESSSGGKKRRK